MKLILTFNPNTPTIILIYQYFKMELFYTWGLLGTKSLKSRMRFF